MRPLTFIFLVLAFVGLASGHELNTLYAPGVGARAMGMGGAFVAASGDPSCIYWNPAGLAGIRKPTASLEGWRMWGWSLVEKHYDPWRMGYVYGPSSSVGHSGLGLAGMAFFVHQTTVAFGTYIPYENSIWDGDLTWRGRTIQKGMESRVLRTSLAVATEIPVLRTGKLSFGLEAFDDRFRYQRSQSYHTSGEVSGMEYVFMDWWVSNLKGGGYGVQTGLLFQPEEALAIGLAVEKRATLDATGITEVYNYEAHFDTVLNDTTYRLSTTLSTPLPTLVKLGFRLHQEPLTFEWDTYFGGGVARSSIIPYSWQGFYDRGIDWVATPAQRMGAELEVLPGIFLRGGAYYGFGNENDEPVYFTGGLGLERWGLKTNGAIERTFSKGGHDHITRATIGLTYALGT